MPCYLFTYHAYGSWIPDRPQGYVLRGQGIQPPSQEVAKAYRMAANEEEALFQDPQQRVIIKAMLDAVTHIDCTAHYVATETSHAHVLVSWKSDRDCEKVGKSLKYRLTRDLKQHCGHRTWLVRDASRQQVKDREHFEYLVMTYLSSHSGLKWCEEHGIYR